MCESGEILFIYVVFVVFSDIQIPLSWLVVLDEFLILIGCMKKSAIRAEIAPL